MKAARVRNFIITESTQNFQIENWLQAEFVNMGDVPVTILGVTLNTKDVRRIGGLGYVIKDEIVIEFDSASAGKNKRLVCSFEAYSNTENSNCDI